ncbi:hypothetical protein HNQ80_004299 [Anaerosolibacter carboniphilus]|uniref:Uncharacterized protein n=1 Tax=Anaerosolibacter carboniphilus TaxID=1417629 RepID=A0A841L6Y7_9FIRM|nr:hypothetical protein [Anaerosolibacter carboniphilus]MBB6218159.1 hypothetical protein [Anaerosolibacter carboniphilus]
MKREKFMLPMLMILLILIMPLIVNILMLFSTPLAKGNIDAWISFYGSYLGGVIGGIATIFGIYLTLKYSKEKDIDDKRRLTLPYISIIEYNSRANAKNEITYEAIYIEALSSMTENEGCYVTLKNIGFGSAIDITFEDSHTGDLQKKLCFNLGLNEEKHFYIKLPSKKIVDGEYKISLLFKNLLGDQYEQTVIFRNNSEKKLGFYPNSMIVFSLSPPLLTKKYTD